MNLLRQLYDQPKRLRLRGWVFQAHLWTGAAIGIYAGVIGLSGSALMFRDEIQAVAVERALPPITAGESMISADSAAGAIREAVPGGHIATLYFPDERTGSYVAVVASDGERQRIVIDPRSGESVEIPESAPAIWRWLTQLHFNLLAGRPGRVVNGVGGLLMALLCFTGLLIWWQGRTQWRRGLGIDWRALEEDQLGPP